MTDLRSSQGNANGLAREIRRARLGVFGVFFVVGFVMAAWLVNIPAIQARADVSHGTLGILLVVLGGGGVIAMQVCGFLIGRLGSKTVAGAAVAFVVVVVAINLPALTSSPVALGVALFVFGLGNGASDVAMNDQAVIVEQRYGRPIMSAFHALWSIGGAAGAVWGAAGQALGVSVQGSVLAAAAMAALLAAYFLRLLLSSAPEAEAAATSDTSATTTASGSVRLRMVAYGVLAFLLMLSEGVANDWAALHAVERLHQPYAHASLAYGTFAVAMTLGRLGMDRVAHRFGPSAVVRYGSLAAAAGMGVVVVSPAYPLTLLGWAVYGLGLAGTVPQLFTAAGNLPSARGSVVLARVVGAGYVGMLAGPALIGFVAGKIGLSDAFILPLLFCLVGVALAAAVGREETEPQAATPSLDGAELT